MTSAAVIAEERDAKRECNNSDCMCRRVDWLAFARQAAQDHEYRKSLRRKKRQQ